MATEEQIKQWKDEYGSLYRVSINGNGYIFRTLNRDDYIAIQGRAMMAGPAFDNELEVVETVLLEPTVEEIQEDLKNRAGVVTTLSEKIMLRSGFQQVEEEEL